MERELGALAHRPDEQRQSGPERHLGQRRVPGDHRLEDVGEAERAHGHPDDDHADEEADIGGLVHQERLVAGIDVGVILPVVGDQ